MFHNLHYSFCGLIHVARLQLGRVTTNHSKIYSKSEINLALNCHSNQVDREGGGERVGRRVREAEKGRYTVQ